MYSACISRETFVFTVFRRVSHSNLKLKLCRHACRRRDQIIPTCRHGKDMPTTALETTKFYQIFLTCHHFIIQRHAHIQKFILSLIPTSLSSDILLRALS